MGIKFNVENRSKNWMLAVWDEVGTLLLKLRLGRAYADFIISCIITCMLQKNQYALHYAPQFEHVIQALDTLQRTGWVQWKIRNPETVWEHILAVRKLAISYKDKLGLNDTEFRDLLDMIEIHDWPEALVGDGVILGDEQDVEKLRIEKKKREMEAMKKICSDTIEGSEILDLYVRYSNGGDKVARLVKQLEKLQAVFKASEYERTQAKHGLTAEFMHYTQDLIFDSFLTAEFKNIEKSMLVLLLVLAHYATPAMVVSFV